MTEIIIRKCPYCNGTGKKFFLDIDGRVEEIKKYIQIEKVKDETKEG